MRREEHYGKNYMGSVLSQEDSAIRRGISEKAESIIYKLGSNFSFDAFAEAILKYGKEEKSLLIKPT